jgi:hypothetical protein
MYWDESAVILCMTEPITDGERLPDAETESLIRKIAEERPGYWDRVAERIIAEAEAGGW